MRSQLFLSFLLIGLAISSFSFHIEARSMNLRSEIVIILEHYRRSFSPVTAFQCAGTVQINFLRAYKALNITIKNKDGEECYGTTLDIDSPMQFTIYTGGYEPGVYLLEMKDTFGERLYGEFTIDREK